MKGDTKRHANAALTELERRQGGRGLQLDRPPARDHDLVSQRVVSPSERKRRRAKAKAARKARRRTR